MPLVRAGTRDERELPARVTPEFSGIGGALNAKFLECVHRHKPLRCAEGRGRRQPAAKASSLRRIESDANIGTHTVDRIVVFLSPLAIYAELSVVTTPSTALRIV